MKQLLLFTAALAVAAGAVEARTLTPEEALSRLNSSPAKAPSITGKTSFKLVDTGKVNDTPAYYVFADGSQTMFVGADDLAEPLLGYIDNPNFNADDMPPQMKWWLSEYAREIEYASQLQARGVQPRQKVISETVTNGGLKRASKSAIAPLCATTWDQGAPYNNSCPTKSGTRTYTGCVATAMAQVMKYHSYPASGTGSHSYTWNNQTLSMNFASTSFDWSNMLNTYASSTSGTTTQRSAIATLMKACGYAVDMEYGVASDGGSGASSFAIAPALVNYFGYDKATHTEFRDYYSETEWEDMIYDNLKSVGPVVYCGASNEGGHCFVCDGYNTSGYFHINWGWSGQYDGYFKLSALNPEGQGIGGYAGGYNTQQDATLGIRKPVSGSVLPSPYLAIEGTLKASASSRTLTFSATNGGFYNMGQYSGTFSVGVALTNSSGTVQYVGEKSLGTVQPGYGTAQLQISIPTSVAADTYQASLVYKVGSGSWQPFKYIYGNPNYVNITVSSSSISVGSTGSSTGGGSSSTTGEISVTGYTSSTGFVVGQTAKVTATVKNTYSTSQTATVSAYLCQISNSQYSIKAQLGSNSVTVPANSSKTTTFSSTLSSSLATGTYYLVFADADNYIISTPEAVEVTSGSSSTTGEVTVTSASSSTGFTIGASATVSATFKNTYSSSKTISAKALLCTKGSSSYSIAATLATQSVTIAANSTKTASFTGTVSSSLSAGTYYLIIADSDNNILSDVQAVEVKAAAATTGEVTVTSASSSTGFTIGASATVSATFKNTYSSSKTISAKALLCTKGSSSYSIAATLATQSVTIAANSTKTVSFTGTVSSSLSAGTYYLIIADSDNNILSDVQAVEVKAAAATTGEISVTSATSSTGFTIGQAVSVSAVVKSTYSSSQTVTVQAYLCTKGTSSYSIVASLGNATVTVPANSTKTATISSTLSSSITAGTYYLVICDSENVILNTPATVEVKEPAATSSSSLTINSVTTSTGFKAGSTCTLNVTFANTTTATQKATVTPTFYTKSGSTYTKVATLSAKAVSVTRNSTSAVSFSSTLSSSLAAGTYYLQFIDANGANVGNKVYSLTVESGSSSRYTVRSFAMDNTNNVDPDNAHFSIEVEANEDIENEQFVALIYPFSTFNLSEVAMALFETQSLSAGSVANIHYFGALNGLEAGKRYVAMLFSLKGDSFFSGFDYVDTILFKVNDSTGVDSIEADSNEEALYFDLKGIRVDSDKLAPGVYIKVTSEKSEKIVIK